MTTLRLVLQGARFYWRTHLGVVLGAALATIVLTGSLLVGDSVKATLKRQALDRVGKAEVATTGGDRFFRAALADELGGAAPVLMLRGSVVRPDGASRVNQAQVLGVDARFWQMAPGAARDLPKDEIALNARAAAQLGVQAGETLIVRVEKPGFFSKDAPLSGEENEVIAIRAKVARIVTDAEFGRFALQASQVPPATVFVPLALLQQRLAFDGRANLLLQPASAVSNVAIVGGATVHVGRFAFALPDWLGERLAGRMRTPGDVQLASARASLESTWQLADASLEVRKLPAGGVELRSPRVFLDPAIVAAAPRGVDSLTYLVNELRAGDKAVPYSMVSAVDAPSSGFLPAELDDNEIVITQWLADQLGVGLNGKVTLKYFVMGERRQLTEQSREFEVIQILPMTDPHLDSLWMPDFPGLSDKANCRDWQPGFALDNTKIRDEDEAYWQKYRGTPKAFVNISIGQEMWGNRWGNVTSIRYAAPMTEQELSQQLLAKLTPEMVGLSFLPLREQALAATNAPVDFGQLFVSFSFFLIAAAAVLTGLLFVFSLEQRNAEAGLLLALGLRPKQVRRLFLAEGAVLALVGSVIGAIGAVLYTKIVLRALATVWRGAVGAVDFQFGANAATLPIGVISGVLVALLAMWLASRRQLRHSARELLAGEATEQTGGVQQRGTKLITGVAVGSLILALVLPLVAGGPGAFFGAGSLLLIGGLLLALRWLRALAVTAKGMESVTQLGTRNAARRRGRSLATIAVLASGVFMVVAVDSFRKAPPREGDTSDPGTGGFALVAESALPIYEDLNSAKGREAYGLSEEAMRGVHVVPMRVRDGDDASCLNLNRASQPRLLGTPPTFFRQADGFRFAPKSLWDEWRSQHRADEVIPGIVDANTLQWALQMKLGDVIEYRDERGQPFRVRLALALVGSILQGNVLIDESAFIQRFPNSGGYRFFLIDAPADRVAAVRSELSRALADRGLEVVSTAQRLGEFNAVENTYLSIFQALGGLGLLLGSAGLAIVVARNVLERRREFGLLEAVGFRPRQLRQLVFAEHRWLIVAALLIGTASALLAVWPQLAWKAGGFPVREIGMLLAALALGCVFWTWLATRIALRGTGVASLRSE
jgi:ABC-type antimicrobial peptide transport system permease subunit